MKPATSLRFVMFCYSLCLPNLLAQPRSAIVGSVEDDAGRGIPDISVRLLPMPPLTVAAAVPETRSAPSGAFRFDGLTPGRYSICAGASAKGYLDTCAWSTQPLSDRLITVAAGQQQTVSPIRMALGARLRVNMLDGGGLLDRDEPRPNQRLLVTVGVPGVGFTFLPVAANGGGQRAYEMLVPRGRSVRLRVKSDHFRVAGGDGRELDLTGGHQVDVPVPAQGNVPPLSFRVVGAQPR